MTPHDFALGAIDPTADRSVYRQIADQLRDLAQDRLQPGDQLPSESQLVAHYGVTRVTVRRALELLKGEGVVVAEHGRGFFVRRRPVVLRQSHDRLRRRHRDAGKGPFAAEAEAAGTRPTVDRVAVTTEPADEEVRIRLGLAPGTEVVVRSRRYLHDGRPVQTAVACIPADIAAGTAITDIDPGPGGIYARIEEAGHQLDRFTEEVHARMPSHDEAVALQLPPGVPVIELTRTAYAVSGRAVETSVIVMAADVYVLDYEIPAH
ncbi:MAG: GntR family transcriptional regulator [Streptomycetaceae bacterium]|nr:GntR family transcriptional regulator [Streptomycetaceae bacterium]NUS53376.1 GntR family transcriptional regulator [Streptomycetaceae bacterium]